MKISFVTYLWKPLFFVIFLMNRSCFVCYTCLINRHTSMVVNVHYSELILSGSHSVVGTASPMDNPETRNYDLIPWLLRIRDRRTFLPCFITIAHRLPRQPSAVCGSFPGSVDLLLCLHPFQKCSRWNVLRVFSEMIHGLVGLTVDARKMFVLC